MTDVLKSWAEKLNGIESFASLPQGTEKQLIQDNLTVLFIDKDDEYRFRGVYHYDGSMLDDDPFTLSFYKSGTCLGDNRIDFIETDFCFDPQTQEKYSNYSWAIETEIPHADFDYGKLERKIFCKGIIFESNFA